MLISPEASYDHVWGSLALARTKWADHSVLTAEAMEDYPRLLSLGFTQLPFFLVVDVYLIVTLHHQAEFVREGVDGREWQDEHRAILQRYEREFLGRLLLLPALTDALEITVTAEEKVGRRQRVMARLFSVLGPMFESEFDLNPSYLRDSETRDLDQPRILESIERLDERAVAVHFKSLDGFLRRVQQEVRWDRLLTEEDLFELTHFEELSTDHLRLGCRQILDVERRLQSSQPIQNFIIPEDGNADTAYLDETHYPTGGLAGLTNKGTFENLVLSELAYLTEEDAGINLFDLRYIENELLYYMRDSGQLRRKRRTVHLVFDVGDWFLRKSIGYDYQFSILLQGFALRLLRDLFKIFEKDSVHFHFTFLPVGDPEHLARESGLLRVILGDFIKHEWVSIRLLDSLDLRELPDPRRKGYVILVTSDETRPDWEKRIKHAEDEDLPLSIAVLNLGSEPSDTTDHGCTLPIDGAPWADLLEPKEELLKALV